MENSKHCTESELGTRSNKLKKEKRKKKGLDIANSKNIVSSFCINLRIQSEREGKFDT